MQQGIPLLFGLLLQLSLSWAQGDISSRIRALINDKSARKGIDRVYGTYTAQDAEVWLRRNETAHGLRVSCLQGRKRTVFPQRDPQRFSPHYEYLPYNLDDIPLVSPRSLHDT